MKKSKINLSGTGLITLFLVSGVVLVALNAGFTWFNRYTMLKNTEMKAQTTEVIERLDQIFEADLRSIDLGLRGYALTQNEQLLNPTITAIQRNADNLRRLDTLFAMQGLDSTRIEFVKVREAIMAYVAVAEKMKSLVEQNNIEGFVQLLKEDKGFDAWHAYEAFYYKTKGIETARIQQADTEYSLAMDGNVVAQALLILLLVPTICFVIFRLHKEEKERKTILMDFQRSNSENLFNEGDDDTIVNGGKVIENSIENLKKASAFIKEIAKGNYKVDWHGLTKENRKMNTENLVGNLLRMRDEMQLMKAEDEKRLWATEGLSKFSEIARQHQDNLEALCYESVRFLSKYLGAQQGCIFVLNEEKKPALLEMKGCYAFEKKKFVEMSIEPGQQLVGQVFLEGKTVLLTEVPQGYIRITSGLGDAAPCCIVVVPLRYNDKTEAVMELAGFDVFQPFQIDFLEKAGAVIASALMSAHTSQKMQQLLNDFQKQTEELRSQEEEMRQNMEELNATQEEMQRKSYELQQRIDALTVEKNSYLSKS